MMDKKHSSDVASEECFHFDKDGELLYLNLLSFDNVAIESNLFHVLECNNTSFHRKNRVVLSEGYIFTGDKLCTPVTDDNVANLGNLTGI